MVVFAYVACPLSYTLKTKVKESSSHSVIGCKGNLRVWGVKVSGMTDVLPKITSL